MSKRVRTAGGSGTDRASDELGVTVRYPARDDGSLAEVDGYGFTKLVKHHTVCMGARVCVRVRLGKNSCVWTRACGHVCMRMCVHIHTCARYFYHWFWVIDLPTQTGSLTAHSPRLVVDGRNP